MIKYALQCGDTLHLDVPPVETSAKLSLFSFRLSYGHRVGWSRFGWNFHGSLHEGCFWRQGTARDKDVVHGKDHTLCIQNDSIHAMSTKIENGQTLSFV